MTNSWLLDLFCHYVRAKYGNAWMVTADALGREYGAVLLVEAATGQRALCATFIEVHFPFKEIRGLHYPNAADGWAIFYSRHDETTEQLRTKLHEVGEIVEERLSELWPDYGMVASVRRIFEGDAKYDRFADEALRSAFSLLAKAAKFLWEMGIQAWHAVRAVLSPYANDIRRFFESNWREVVIVAALVLLYLLLVLIGLIVNFLKRLVKVLLDSIKAILSFALVFLTRLFFVDQEIRVPDYFRGQQCA